MWRQSIAGVFLAALLLASCSSHAKLTTTSALGMAQAWVDKNSKDFSINYSQLLPQIASILGRSTLEDYGAGNYSDPPRLAFQRLLKAGFITSSLDTLEFPDISGTYQGTYFKDTTFNVILSMSHDKPTLSGNWTATHVGGMGNGQCIGTLSGIMNPDNSVTLVLGIPRIVAYGCAMPHADELVRFSIRRSGSSTELSAIDHNTYPLDLDGQAAHGSIQFKKHTYTANSNLGQILSASDHVLNVGHVQIDSFQQVLLGLTDTMAGGQFQWHVELDPVVQAIEGKKDIRGIGSAVFQKTPDGDWVCTSVKLES